MISFLDAAAGEADQCKLTHRCFCSGKTAATRFSPRPVSPGSPGGCYPVVRDGAPTSVAQSGASQGRARMRHPPVKREPWPRSVES